MQSVEVQQDLCIHGSLHREVRSGLADNQAEPETS